MVRIPRLLSDSGGPSLSRLLDVQVAVEEVQSPEQRKRRVRIRRQGATASDVEGAAGGGTDGEGSGVESRRERMARWRRIARQKSGSNMANDDGKLSVNESDIEMSYHERKRQRRNMRRARSLASPETHSVAGGDEASASVRGFDDDLSDRDVSVVVVPEDRPQTDWEGNRQQENEEEDDVFLTDNDTDAQPLIPKSSRLKYKL